MKLRQQFSGDEQDRAVSPVIGVILMVAITVILAAVIGTFVLGMADDVGDSAPQASMGIQDHTDSYEADDTDENTIVVQHSGGAELPADSFRIQIRQDDNNALVGEWDSENWEYGSGQNATNPGTLTAELNGAGTGMSEDAIISNGDQITFIDDTGGSSFHDDTRYRVRFVHKETGDTIAESTVTLR